MMRRSISSRTTGSWEFIVAPRTTLSSTGDGDAELAEDLDEAVDVAVVVLDRQGPLLLVARRQEDAAVDHPGPGGVEQIGVGLEEAPVVDQGLGSVGDAALATQ